MVAATGLATFAYVPDELLPLAPGGPRAQGCCPTRASTLTCPRMRVAVVGGGQSALESAALLPEAGADVEVLVRDARVSWGSAPAVAAAVRAAAGRPGVSAGDGLGARRGLRCSGRRTTAAGRLQLFRRALGPSGGWWLRERVEGVVPVRRRAVWSGRGGPGPRCTCVSAARAADRPIASSTMCWRPPGTGSLWSSPGGSPGGNCARLRAADRTCPRSRRTVCVHRWAASLPCTGDCRSRSRRPPEANGVRPCVPGCGPHVTPRPRR